MSDRFAVRVSAGSLRSGATNMLRVGHAWTAEGVEVKTQFTGAHLLHVAVAACVLNDVYREAGRHGIEIAGVAVDAEGQFDEQSWTSRGISYRVDVSSDAEPDEVRRLLESVEEVAEIPRAIRAGASVRRVHGEVEHADE